MTLSGSLSATTCIGVGGRDEDCARQSGDDKGESRCATVLEIVSMGYVKCAKPLARTALEGVDDVVEDPDENAMGWSK